MNDLDIPEAAVDAVALAIDPDEPIDELDEEDRDEIRVALIAAAPHLIAAELRRQAALLDMCAHLSARVDVNRTHAFDADALRARADELDGDTQ